MVTAELAVSIPAVVFVLLLCLAGLVTVVDQIRCVDAARLGSRAAARGDSDQAVISLARRAAPPGARVDVTHSGGDAVVRVHVEAGGWGGFLPRWQLSAEGRTPVEATTSRQVVP